MEIREFAERVLFSTSLEEKLRAPEQLSDERPGTPAAAPSAPGRPSHLVFKSQHSGKAEFPGLHELETRRERGRLLHFFANHELLATELMALVLLRFPDAPAAFRRGVVQTLKDEQEHTRLYLQRMRDCGIEFGELPVSGFFWRTVSTMENPMDYVSSLCLTFEQANLDFARHFSRGFATVGDAETASLLERIYRDEIGHVAYGLKWFRRWKNPTESDWEAFCRQLKFPLSPQRAKGFAVNVDGRRAAGLDPDFIERLTVFAQSKGRTPSVYLFNPFAEAQIAFGQRFHPNKKQMQLAADLQNIPQFLCREDDIVLVSRRPTIRFLNTIRSAGFHLPEFVELDAPSSTPVAIQTKLDAPALTSRKLGRLRPWAWSPHALQLLRPLFPLVTADLRTADHYFNSDLARLFSKSWSADFLRRFLQSNGPHAQTPLCSPDKVGETAQTIESALSLVNGIRARGHHKVIIKQSLGVAGANALRLLEPTITPAQLRWMENSVAAGQQLVVEPWLDRIVDFSVQLEMTSSGLRLCGFTGLATSSNGQFHANWAESHHHKRIPSVVIAPFSDVPAISRHLITCYEQLRLALEGELRHLNFAGPLGIDCFVYRCADGQCRLKPVVEINPRYTMGRLTVELMKQTRPGSAGRFQIINRPQMKRLGFESFAALADSLQQRFPLQLEGDPKPRIREGILVLNDPEQADYFLGVFEVAAPGCGWRCSIEEALGS